MKSIGLYIHIPFCEKKCNYCDFCSMEAGDIITDEYISSLILEMKRWKEVIKDYKVKSVFIGGGTPSLLSLTHIDRIIETLYLSFNVIDNSEFTIESNPGTLDRKKIKYYLNHGINRLSIGLQAWQNKLLETLGRIHNNQDFVTNYITARELGFSNINIDLMFGLPDQTIHDWIETLEKVGNLAPEHISAYSLKIEESTPFGKLFNDGKLNLPGEENDRLMYHTAIDYLKCRGYFHYEISNFALRGKTCVHNNIYWNNEEYLGLGLGSHSFINKRRFSNDDNLPRYIKKLNNNEDPKIFEYKNSKEDDIEEAMFLGLRKTKGININDFITKYGKSPLEIYEKQLKKLESQGLIKISENNIKLTIKGYDLSNIVFTEFILDRT